jgi:hypothetical protein
LSTTQPLYGTTAQGHPVYEHTRRYLPAMLRIRPDLLKADLKAADSFNAKVAVLLTRFVGTMWCFWVFNGIALISLPSILSQGGLQPLIAWISSNWIQLILLPALMVGQNLQNAAADARSAKTFEDIERVKGDVTMALDRLDTTTDGGLKAVLDAINALAASGGAAAASSSLPTQL